MSCAWITIVINHLYLMSIYLECNLRTVLTFALLFLNTKTIVFAVDVHYVVLKLATFNTDLSSIWSVFRFPDLLSLLSFIFFDIYLNQMRSCRLLLSVISRL